ncbi:MULTISPECIES: sporulation integral membrane protein YlbJ [Clostridium]|uniref:Sporulation integral membrane protein YlbJ n=1 Tax=Clostridium senegalense TaxID=1465809 RepID=A0A6M0H0Z6_9CLOT|nr:MULTISPECIES: sporulation integral membrane protein YlbJ [Clostridium]NEU03302.1 sporulation integral membrane protein YlbJ [Clostridium senegalense]
MVYYLIFIIIILLSFIFIKKYKFNGFFTLLCTLTILYIISDPKHCIELTILGCKLFFYSVFPSLFPFLILVNMIISCGGINIYSKILGNFICTPLHLPKNCSLALLVSVFCGYPLGARYATILYSEKFIDFKTYERLLNIASNGSPLFIVGAVGTSMLLNPKIGYLLLLSNMLSCIAMAFVLPNKIKSNKNLYTNKIFTNVASNHSVNLGQSFMAAVEDAIKTSLSIGGFIVIFSVLIGIINDSVLFNTVVNKLSNISNIPLDVLKGISLGILELTNGCNIIANGTLSLNNKLILISFLIGFSGISITSQVYSIISKFNVSIKKYLFLKLIQGAISAFFTASICKIPLLSPVLETFNTNPYFNNINSQLYILISMFILIPFLAFNIKNLFKRI